MNIPEISIIIPVYKVEEYLPKCVESILGQSFTDFEVWLIDDGSPDGSGVLCDAYANADSRIKVVHKKNGGVSAARNRGLQLARGKWITFVDSDDWIDQDYLARLMTGADETVQLVLGGFKMQLVNGTQVCAAGGDFRYTRQDIVRFYDDFISSSLVRTVWGGLYRCSLIEQNGLLFDVAMEIGEDTLFNFNYINTIKGSIAVVNSSGYNWRSVEGAASLSKNLNVEGWYKYIELYYTSLITQFGASKRSVPVKNSLVADCCTAVFMLYSRGAVQCRQLAKAYSFLAFVPQEVEIGPLKRKGRMMIFIGWLFKYSKTVFVSHSLLRISFGLMKFKQRFVPARRRPAF